MSLLARQMNSESTPLLPVCLPALSRPACSEVGQALRPHYLPPLRSFDFFHTTHTHPYHGKILCFNHNTTTAAAYESATATMWPLLILQELL